MIFGPLHEYEVWQEGLRASPQSWAGIDAVFSQAPTPTQHGDPSHGFNVYVFVCDEQNKVSIELLPITFRDNGFLPGNYLRVGRDCHCAE